MRNDGKCHKGKGLFYLISTSAFSTLVFYVVKLEDLKKTKKCFELQLLSNNASDSWHFLLGSINVSTMQIFIHTIIKICISKDKGEPLLH